MDSASLLVQTEKKFCSFWVWGFLWVTHNYYVYMASFALSCYHMTNNYYVYMASFALSCYHIRMTSGMVLNVIC